MTRLDDPTIKKLTTPGLHADGGSLYIQIKPTGAKTWLFRYNFAGKRREMGLGGWPMVTVGEARKQRRLARELIESGVDPITMRQEAKAEKQAKVKAAQEAVEEAKVVMPTFAEAAESYIAAQEAGWRNDKHVAQWRMTLGLVPPRGKGRVHYCKALQSKPVNEITVEDIADVLRPIWLTKEETARRIRGRLESVLDAAKVMGWRSGENPAVWKGNLKHLLSKQTRAVKHHAAMPYDKVKGFMEALEAVGGMSATALRFLVLTAARSGEVLGATWGEFDLKAKVWTVPASRMKAGREHRVPLSDVAMEILADRAILAGNYKDDEHVFPARGGGPLSVMAFEMCLRRNGGGEATTHGFRSAFRDWVSEETTFQREVAEAALAHLVGDDVERAYRRGDALEKRRKLMTDWADYVTAD